MKPTGIFFVIFFLVCLFISVLFFFLFRHKDTPLPVPRSILPTGLPGMSKKPVEKDLPGMSPTPAKKPLSQTKVKTDKSSTIPDAPLPLIVKVAPPGPPLRKPLMT
jgi:hypothetical protein